MDVAIRTLTAAEAEAAASIVFQAIHEGAANAYTERERWAWSGPAPDPDLIGRRIARGLGFAADDDGVLVGFMSLTGGDHVDLAYVLPRAMGRGVGGALLERLESAAREGGALRLTTDASVVARPFFERHGWRTLKKQTIERRGVPLTNFAMEKTWPRR